jgi:hypothetical protein
MFFYRFNILKLKISKNNIYHAIKYALNMTWDFTYFFFIIIYMFRSLQFVFYIEDFKVLSIQICYEIRIGPHTDV